MSHKSHAHAQAILVGLKFSIDIGIWRVGVEVGCQDLIGMIQKGTPVWGLMVFWLMISIIIFPYFNKAVSTLAIEALSSYSEQVWLEDCPIFIIIFNKIAIGSILKNIYWW